VFLLLFSSLLLFQDFLLKQLSFQFSCVFQFSPPSHNLHSIPHFASAHPHHGLCSSFSSIRPSPSSPTFLDHTGFFRTWELKRVAYIEPPLKTLHYELVSILREVMEKKWNENHKTKTDIIKAPLLRVERLAPPMNKKYICCSYVFFPASVQTSNFWSSQKGCMRYIVPHMHFINVYDFLICFIPMLSLTILLPSQPPPCYPTSQ
jgi:hypothetical protein